MRLAREHLLAHGLEAWAPEFEQMILEHLKLRRCREVELTLERSKTRPRSPLPMLRS